MLDIKYDKMEVTHSNNKNKQRERGHEGFINPRENDVNSNNANNTFEFPIRDEMDNQKKVVPQDLSKDKEEPDGNDEQNEEKGSLDTYKKLLLWILIIVYPILWIVYEVGVKDQLWEATISISAYLSKFSGFLLVYCWIFSELMYKWYPLILGLLLLLSSQKDSAFTSCFTFLAGSFARQYLRLFFQETRPYYDSTRIRLKGSCNCSFGMPSGHSEASTMMYLLLYYELVYKNKTFSKVTKTIWLLVVVYIFLSVMFSRIVYGRHSIAQVFFGCGLALFFISCSLLAKKHLDRFFKKAIYGNVRNRIVLVVINGFVFLLNIVLWDMWFEQSVGDFDFKSKVCAACFEDRNRKVRDDLSKSLTYLAFGLGLSLGISFQKLKISNWNTDALNMHMSKIGILRLLIMIGLHILLIVLLLVKMSSKVIIVVGSILYLLTGLLITYGFMFVCQKLNLIIEGDIVV